LFNTQSGLVIVWVCRGHLQDSRCRMKGAVV
jgi:hypothetical protein